MSDNAPIAKENWMSLSELVWLRDRLLRLKAEGPKDKGFGICQECLYHEYLADLFEELGYHKGYPVDVALHGLGVVESHDALYPGDATTRNKWDRSTADGRLRWKLVSKLIDLISRKIDAIKLESHHA